MDDLLDDVFVGAAKKHQIKTIFYGTAKNITATTCDVEIAGEPTKTGVNLHGIDDNFSSFFRVKPKDGSIVIGGVIEGDTSDACVLQCSEIDEVMVKIGEVFYRISSDGHVIKKGEDTLHQALKLLIEAVYQIVVIYGNNPNYMKLNEALRIIENLLKDA